MIYSSNIDENDNIDLSTFCYICLSYFISNRPQDNNSLTIET